jgi:hypothetical protein
VRVPQNVTPKFSSSFVGNPKGCPSSREDQGLSGWNGSTRKGRLPEDWATLRVAVLRRDKGVCQVQGLIKGSKEDQGSSCSFVATEVDHVERGDNHALENLQAACRPCHLQKSVAEGHAQQARMRVARHRPSVVHPGLVSGE